MFIDVYKGNENVFLILTGMGGSTKGFQNKYVTIAENINIKYGWTVFVVATQSGAWNDEKEYFDKVIKEVGTYTKMMKIDAKEIYAMGTSAGANLLLHNAHRYNKIKKILPINPLLNINYNFFCEFIYKYKGKTTLIVGEKDTSFNYLEMIKKYESDRFINVVMPNADHNFTDMIDVFITLPEEYLFKDDIKK